MKKIKLKYLLLIIIIVILIILLIIKYTKKEPNLTIKGIDIITFSNTEWTTEENNNKLPTINLKGNDIIKINKEIINKYYNISYENSNTFDFKYTIKDNILSILITTIITDNSEYGQIEYTSYNINIQTGKKLTNEELLKKINLTTSMLYDEINYRLLSYYNQDSLNKTMSLEQYKEYLSFDLNNNQLFLDKKALYVYNKFNITQSLVNYNGNIYEIKICDL